MKQLTLSCRFMMVLLILSSKFPDCKTLVNTLTITSSSPPESFNATAVVNRTSSSCREWRTLLAALTNGSSSCRCCCICRNEVKIMSSSRPEVRSPFTARIRKSSNCPEAIKSLIPHTIVISTSRREPWFPMAKLKVSLFILNPGCPNVWMHSTSHITKIAFLIISSRKPSSWLDRRVSSMPFIRGSRASGDSSTSLTAASTRPSSWRRCIKDTISL